MRRSGSKVVMVVISWLFPLVARAEWQQPGEIQKPAGKWQKPREDWQKPGELQVPKGLQAIRVEEKKCQKRLSVGADALFDFDKHELTPTAEETLLALGPLLAKEASHPISIEGHTDSIGVDEYNQKLSERRARSVHTWLVTKSFLPPSASARGLGEKTPIAPNAKPDGTDDPEGRQRNRRVEVVIQTCE